MTDFFQFMVDLNRQRAKEIQMRQAQMQQANEELHFKTLEVLTKLVDVLDCDELSLLCWHCGVKTEELMPTDSGTVGVNTFPANTSFKEIENEIHSKRW